MFWPPAHVYALLWDNDRKPMSFDKITSNKTSAFGFMFDVEGIADISFPKMRILIVFEICTFCILLLVNFNISSTDCKWLQPFFYFSPFYLG